MLKRLFDVVGAGTLLLMFFSLMLAIAMCIKLDTPGPIFFSQRRVGLHRKIIVIHKFRTFHQCEEDCTVRGLVTTRSDSRITFTGKFLRPSHLDELPQLWNVLKGDMSLVGPRPKIPTIIHEIGNAHPNVHRRHEVKPGLTGPGQIMGRDLTQSGIQTGVRLDTEYATNAWSIWRDIGILVRTIGIVLRRKGI